MMDSGAETRRSSRSGGTEITKYEKPLAFHLDMFASELAAYESYPQAAASWRQDILEDIKATIQDMLTLHLKKSSKTRLALQNMSTDLLWEDASETRVRLTKRNLASIDPSFQPRLDRYLLATLKDRIETLRAQARSTLVAIYADAHLKETVDDITANEEDDAYTVDALGRHVELMEKLGGELKAKLPLVEYLRHRELWLRALGDWERDTGSSTSLQGFQGRGDIVNMVAKFRIAAAKILEQSNDLAQRRIDAYEKQKGHQFTMLGIDYSKDHLAMQMSSMARVKTNFAGISEGPFFFDNPGGSAQGDGMEKRFEDETIQPLLDAAKRFLFDPPAIPPQNVGFAVDYS